MNFLRQRWLNREFWSNPVALDWVVMALALVGLCVGILASSRPETEGTTPPPLDATGIETLKETFR